MCGINVVQGGGGAHCSTHPPPHRYTSLDISRTRWATDFKLSDSLNELIFNAKNIFQRPSPTPGYHSKVKSWRMWLKNTFGQFSCESLQDLDVCMTSVQNEVCCWNFGLDIAFDGVLVTVFLLDFFRASTTCNWAILSPWQQKWFHSLFISSQKGTFVDFQQRE